MKSYTFDDVLILPAYSDIESRQEVDTSTTFLGQKYSVPVISANMDYITGPVMLNAMHENGALGILHRFMPWEDQKELILNLGSTMPIFFSAGIRDLEETMQHIEEVAKYAEGVCIDVAHGHHNKVMVLTRWIKTSHATKSLRVIAGNVATREGVEFLVNAGADAVKVGIGAGSVCTTRTVAGVGVPQLSAIVQAAKCTKKSGIPIIADGGIRTSGDVVKALAAGASMVMVGNLFAGTNETPGDTFSINGRQYKKYRGQASFGVNGDRYVKEGIDGFVPAKGPVAPVLNQIRGGLQSSMSYVGARNIKEFRRMARFTKVSSHTLMENSTRVTEMTLGG